MVKKISLEELAGMVKRGFDEVHSKIDGVSKEMREFNKLTNERIDAVAADIRDIRISLEPTIRSVSANELDIQDLKVRVARLEKKSFTSK